MANVIRPKVWMGLVLFLLASIWLAPVGCEPGRRAEEMAAPQGMVRYVAPSGDDANPGTLDHPWQTVQKAAESLAAGETVYIRAGTYHERVVPQNSGSAGSPITYAAYPGESATIDGSSISLPDDLAGLFDISNKSYIRVSGLRVANAGPYDHNAGILVLNSGHITVENNSTYNTHSSGIGVWGSHDVVVAGNTVDEAGGGGYQECISVAGTDAFEVRDNEVLNCHKEGIDAKDGASNGRIYRNHVHHTLRVGIYVDAWDKHTYNIDVYQNVVHDIQDNNGFSIGSEQGGLLENVRVYNNIAYHNRYEGLALHNCCPGPTIHPVRGITVVNNTFYDNGWSVWGGGISVDNPDIQNVVVRNNIVSQNLYFQLAVAEGVPTATLAIDHNLVDGFRGTEGEIYGRDYVEGDPLFANASGADFHLQAKSPAIDAGSAAGAPNTDFEDRPRPLDGNGDGAAAYDMGAYEMGQPTARVYLPLTFKLTASSSPTGLAAVDDFVYQLQNVNLTAIGNTAYDLVVIDYSADGSDAAKFSAAQIAALKHSPGGEKIVLSYMSIGEAETYRFYWQSGWDADGNGVPDPGAPAWLDIENPNWPGNYKVRYWDAGWQSIVLSYTDKLLDAGYDGAYLDIIDAYEYYAGQGRTGAAQEMADFVAAIAAHARARDPDFYILPQNAPELAGLVPAAAYLNIVDGLGQEDIYYGYDADDQATPISVTQYLETYLDVFEHAGKLVLTIDYATTPAHIDDAYTKSLAKGYVPFVTVRKLDQLTINPGHEPD